VNVTITEPATALSGTTTQTNVTCNGLGDGSITLTPSGGTSSFSYSWTGPGTYTSTSQSISGLIAGTYNYTITDANSCVYKDKVTVSEPTLLLISVSSVTNVLCKGNSTGVIAVAATGGNGGYQYKIGSGTYGSNSTFASLPAGIYTIGVKDNNGCTKTVDVTVTEPSFALILTSVSTDVDCNGNKNG
jgi:hypothetical protein